MEQRQQPVEASGSTYEQDLWLRELFRLIEAWRDTRDGTPSKSEAWGQLWKHGHNIGPHWRARAHLASVAPSQQVEDFAAWFRKNCPPGTVISNPDWWSVRILNVITNNRDAEAALDNATPT